MYVKEGWRRYIARPLRACQQPLQAKTMESQRERIIADAETSG